jgi:colanic acid/amylovoran biosynthesis glycosyltransferase
MRDARRIALIASPETYVGPEWATLVSGLVQRGWDTHLVLDDGTPGRLRRRRTAAARVRALDPQIAHFISADHARALLTNPDGGFTGSKVVATFSGHDASVAGLEVPDYYRPLWQRADRLHFTDSAVLARALRRGLPPDKPRASIPLLIDPRAYEPNGRPSAASRPLRVLCAGTLEWTSGYEHGLQALALAAERGVTFECHVVGEGPHLSALLFARHQLGLDGKVSFENPLRDPLTEQIAWADVFLAPTVIDGLPDHVIEAAAMGVCLVLADPGPLGELEADESVAITVARRDPGAVAEALAELAVDPARRTQLGTAARTWALERFPVEEHLDRMEELYRLTLNGRR